MVIGVLFFELKAVLPFRLLFLSLVRVTYFSVFLAGRLGRSNLGYSGGRSSVSSQDSHGLYSSRQGMSYGGGALSS